MDIINFATEPAVAFLLSLLHFDSQPKSFEKDIYACNDWVYEMDIDPDALTTSEPTHPLRLRCKAVSET